MKKNGVLPVLVGLDLKINCDIIFNEKIEAISLDLETRVIVWKVNLL